MPINFPNNPTLGQTYNPTELRLHNTVVNIDKDYVKFTTGSSSISAIYLTKYVGVDEIAFFAIQQGSSWTAGNDTSQMLVYSHFGPSVNNYGLGDNILAQENIVLQANTTYTMWIQQTGSNLTEYVFSTNPSYFGESSVPSDYSSDAANPTEIAFVNSTSTWQWNGFSWEILPVSSPTFTNLSVTGSVSGNVVGTVTGNVTGTVSSLSNHGIDDLNDVTITGTPTNGQVLGYNSTSNYWEAISLTSTFTGGSIPNALLVNNNTASTNTTTGALRVSGGAGIVGNANIGGSISGVGHIEIKTSGELRLSDGDSSNYVGFKSPSSVSVNKVWTLPATDGDAGQVLSTDGSGVLSWITATGGAGGSTPPGGSNTQIQYNASGVFAGNSALTFNSSTSTLTAPNVVLTGTMTTPSTITVTDTTASTSSSNGSVVVSGGVGIQGQINIAGSVNRFTSTTNSTSTSTGALIIAGGIGIASDAHVGGTITASTAPTDSSHLTNKAYVDSNVLAFSMAFGV